MRTNAHSVVTAIAHLPEGERFQHVVDTYGGRTTYVIEEVGYSGGHTSFVGRRMLAKGDLSKRTTLLNNIDPRDVPDGIRESIVGAIRAHVGEQARALGLLR
jgi:hypothetical protein